MEHRNQFLFLKQEFGNCPERPTKGYNRQNSGYLLTTAMSHSFLEALAHLPDCGGAAIIMDRLVIILCDLESIDEAIAFTVDTA
ncbi:MAG: hypothetical protein PHQ43_04190 [Dehalococcoidales bacterium]|nr:hypothetical protein [Dehalococcoidales bacterium]